LCKFYFSEKADYNNNNSSSNNNNHPISTQKKKSKQFFLCGMSILGLKALSFCHKNANIQFICAKGLPEIYPPRNSPVQFIIDSCVLKAGMPDTKNFLKGPISPLAVSKRPYP